jgi:Cysteine rich repeat
MEAMYTRSSLILILFLGSLSSALAASGTPQEQTACRGDAQRFCSRAGQDEMAVLNCLIANRKKLSRACTQVLQRNGQLPSG